MKKKVLALLCGGAMAFSLFAAPGNTVNAAKPANTCDCPYDFLTGAERNKIVAGIISSDEFKTTTKELKSDGYKWNGANTLQVLYLGENTAVLVPFYHQDGSIKGAFFVNGLLDVIMPLEEHSH